MNKLTMEFDPTQDWVSDEVKVAEPYSFLSRFFNAELGRHIDSVRHWMKDVQEALDGNDVDTGFGNGWKFEGNAQIIKFTTLSKYDYTIPTPLLLEAFERYVMYLEARGLESTKRTPNA